MTKKVSIKAQKRGKEKIAALREKGLVPAVVYSDGSEAEQIQINKIEFDKVIEAGGDSSLIDLNIEGGENIKVVIKEIQHEPARGAVLHVDFYKVNMKQKITVNTPLNFINIAPAVKDYGGILNYNRYDLELSCLPGDIAEHIDVDLSVLKTMDDAIMVRDVKLPENNTLVTEESELVVNVNTPRLSAKKEEEPAEGEEGGKEGEEPAKEGEEKPAEGGDEKKE